MRSLPRLNYSSQLLRQRMYEGNDAIMRRWLRPPFRIDGWRLDVANMLGRQGENQLGREVMRGMRRAVKEENPDAWILGENFFDGTSHLQGGELDATMNYRGFMNPVLQWISGRDLNAILDREYGVTQSLSSANATSQLNLFRSAVPESVALNQLNLLDSHDTPRFLTMLGGDIELFKVALAFLFTYQGAPCVYYGDEIGMQGGKDPDCRRPMEWRRERWNEEIFAYYRRLIALRRQSSALQGGALQMLEHPNGIAFLREDAKERLVIALSRGRTAGESWSEDLRLDVRRAGIDDDTKWREFFSGRCAQVRDGRLLAMPDGVGACIWREEVRSKKDEVRSKKCGVAPAQEKGAGDMRTT